MMQDTTSRCAGRAEDLLLKIDGRLDAVAAERLERHMAECAACERLAASLRSLDLALVSRFSAPILTDVFDRSVLAQLDALPRRDLASAADLLDLAERERTEALADLRARTRRGLGTGLLDLVGVGAILWAGGQLVPRLLGLAGQLGAMAPAVGGVVMAAAVAALAIAAAYLVARVEQSAAAV